MSLRDIMVKSHRSSTTLFHQWSHSDRSSSTTLIPGSPTQFDPFGSQINLPEPIRSRPPSLATTTAAPTPKIVLASPSTSTIHYLFPTSDTNNHLSANPEARISRSRSARVNRTSRGSFDQIDKEKTVERKIIENSFPLPPSRVGKAPSSNILGPAKRVPSGGQMRRDDERPAYHTVGHAPMKTLKRQPSSADLGKRLQVEVGRSSVVIRDVENRKREAEKWVCSRALTPLMIKVPRPDCSPEVCLSPAQESICLHCDVHAGHPLADAPHSGLWRCPIRHPPFPFLLTPRLLHRVFTTRQRRYLPILQDQLCDLPDFR